MGTLDRIPESDVCSKRTVVNETIHETRKSILCVVVVGDRCAEMRQRGAPGLSRLTRPEVEVRARDVLLRARAQHERRKAAKHQQSPSRLLEEARGHLEKAHACELATHGPAQLFNPRAASALGALGNLAVLAGDLERAADLLRDARRAALTRSKQATATSAALAQQLARLLRREDETDAKRARKRKAELAFELQHAASFFELNAKKAAAYCRKSASEDDEDCDEEGLLLLECFAGNSRHTTKGDERPALEYSPSQENKTCASHRASRRELANEACKASAKKAKHLWLDAATALKDRATDDADDLIDALEHAFYCARLCDGDAAATTMKQLRHLAKLKSENARFEDAARDCLKLAALAHKAGAHDLAAKANKTRARALQDARDQAALKNAKGRPTQNSSNTRAAKDQDDLVLDDIE